MPMSTRDGRRAAQSAQLSASTMTSHRMAGS
jgi:hypothetical protein